MVRRVSRPRRVLGYSGEWKSVESALIFSSLFCRRRIMKHIDRKGPHQHYGGDARFPLTTLTCLQNRVRVHSANLSLSGIKPDSAAGLNKLPSFNCFNSHHGILSTPM